MTKILIAQPTSGSVVTGTVGYLMDLGRALSQAGIAWDYRALTLAEIALSRNIFASYVIADNVFSHVLFMDADMGVHPPTVLRMIDFGQPVVAAACPKRFLDWDLFRQRVDAEAERPAAERRPTQELLDLAHSYNVEPHLSDGTSFVPERRGPFLTVPAIGTGLMLIHRDVFEIMLAHGSARARPGYRDLPLLEKAPVCDFFAPREAPDGSMAESEDISFCRRWVEECGGKIWADVDSRVLHFGMRGHVGRYAPNVARDFPGLGGGTS